MFLYQVIYLTPYHIILSSPSLYQVCQNEFLVFPLVLYYFLLLIQVQFFQKSFNINFVKNDWLIYIQYLSHTS